MPTKKLRITKITKRPPQRTFDIEVPREHCFFANGILSSNCKRIPIQTIPRDPLMRGMFVSAPGWKLIEADYSQVELRLAAWYSRDPTMNYEFEHGEDAHKNTASEIFKIPADQVTKDQRKYAKSTNFGCLAPGELVAVEGRGLVPIETVCVGDIAAPGGRVSHTIDNGTRDFFLLATTQGYEIKVTSCHKIMTANGWKQAGELRPGDQIRLGLCESHAGVDPEIPSIGTPTKHRDVQVRVVPRQMSPELGTWLGLWIAEGSIKRPAEKRRNFYHWVSFYNQDRELTQQWLETTQQLFPDSHVALREMRIRNHQVAELRVDMHNCYVAEWLMSLGTGDRSNNKRVPGLIFQSTRDTKAAFLRGLFEGDGYIRLKNGKHEARHTVITYKSKSRQLCRGIQLLLSSFGIASRIAPVRTSWNLTIKSCHVDRFMEQIGFISDRKNEKWKRRDSEEPVDHYTTFERLIPIGELPALDLTVEDHHSFYCSGAHVSNSLYEGGPRTLADSINDKLELDDTPVTATDAEKFQDAWRKRYRGFVEWRFKVHFKATKDRSVVSPLGRIRRLPAVISEDQKERAEALRQGPNSLIQGLGSDLGEFALIRIQREFQKLGFHARFRWALHDALFIEAPDCEVWRVCQIMKREMERPVLEGLYTPVEFKVFKERWGGGAYGELSEVQAIFEPMEGQEVQPFQSILTEVLGSQKVPTVLS